MSGGATGPRLLVVEHIVREGLGALGDWLTAAGAELHRHRVYADGPPPAAVPGGVDGVVAMGGGMGVGDADRLPWLYDEMALLRDAVERGVPVLGVCLGAQLLAAATGGRVERGGAGPELGADFVTLRDESATDPLFAGVPRTAPVVQWHWDTITALPPAAAHLAASDRYPHQAFRLGDRAWGLQFHVEATPDMVAQWAASDAAEVTAAGSDPDALVENAAARWPAVAAAWRAVGAALVAAAGGSPVTEAKPLPVDRQGLSSPAAIPH